MIKKKLLLYLKRAFTYFGFGEPEVNKESQLSFTVHWQPSSRRNMMVKRNKECNIMKKKINKSLPGNKCITNSFKDCQSSYKNPARYYDVNLKVLG